MEYRALTGVWIDVGAHLGETTLEYARRNPSLVVYAFEPNWKVARQVMGVLPNFVVFPMAVSDKDGVAEFYINAVDVASSLLPMNTDAVRSWTGGESLRIEGKTIVPTIRLDTFMRNMEIETVDYLKVDTQGADFAVIRSAGSRLKDIRKINLEVDVTPARLYEGSASRSDIVSYIEGQGLALAATEKQSFGQEENLTFLRELA